MAHTTAHTTELMRFLWRGGEFGYLWRLSDKRAHWLSVGALDGEIDILGPGWEQDVFFGVHPTRTLRTGYERGRAEDVVAANCLFADFDDPDALPRIDSLQPAPQVIVASGKGFHVYWLLAEPVILSDDVTRRDWAALQRWWVRHVGADHSACDLARVLRVPGTRNGKYDPPRPVSFIRCELDRPYDNQELMRYILDARTAELEREPAGEPAQGRPSAGESPIERYNRETNIRDLLRQFGYTLLGARYFVRPGKDPKEGVSGTIDDANNRAYTFSSNDPAYDPRDVSPSGAGCTLRPFDVLCRLSFGGDAKAAVRWLTQGEKAGQPGPAQNGSAPPAEALPPAVQAALDEALEKASELGSDVDREDSREGETEGKPTDDDLAEQWLKLHPDSMFGLGSMRRYRYGVWEALPDNLFERELLEVLQANKGRGIRPTSRLLASVKKLAQVKASLPDYVWDADPNILVCANGTLELDTMTLREHRMEDYATSAIPHPYIPDATAPTLEHVLQTTVPEAAGLIQEFAGYALTTDTSHEIALWFCGPSGSGKSTIILALQTMLGKRCGVLGLADIERSNFALSDLPGRTLLISTEQPSLYVRASYKLNALISGEVLRVEKKYADPFELKPTAKVLWASNEMPRLDPGDGLFRRVKVIQFPKHTFVPDPTVKQRIANEGPGILAWALEGLRRLRERGHFLIPPCVEEASQQFQKKNDVPAAFVEECCDTGPDCKASADELYRAYKTWCEENGHRPQSSTALAEEWARLGFQRYRANGRTFYRGVSLRQIPF